MHRFDIHPVHVGNGTVALSPLPGCGDGYARDFVAIRDWRPGLVISVTTTDEMLQEGAIRLGDDLRANGVRWVHLPIEDFGTPTPPIDTAWADIGATVSRILSCGGRVLVHCRGGCGRSGMIVLRLMVEHGESPDTALKRLRAVRKCAVETDSQMQWAARPVIGH
ncbi:protein-tyrosine phosphatase family protein [Ruegeria profundi]|uniref:protein-tyrosine phosphatase family protein n=1 Tax=Ruegeria profundi TaxID=1685378 RepID=UPI001CD3DAD2|nr:dual specificity protein phosphatase family protein [Ruegeria profundi]MCA0929256.1 dual specificity protein phosphatase family protein [Ruegeria profundi]